MVKNNEKWDGDAFLTATKLVYNWTGALANDQNWQMTGCLPIEYKVSDRYLVSLS